MTDSNNVVDSTTLWEQSGGHPDADESGNPDSNLRSHLVEGNQSSRGQVHLALAVCALSCKKIKSALPACISPQK